MSTRDELEAASRTSWGIDVDAAMRRHPVGSGATEDDRWTSRDQAELNRVLTAEAHPALPPNWQAWADENTPEDNPIPDAVAFLLLGFLALIVPALIVVSAWHWLVQ